MKKKCVKCEKTFECLMDDIANCHCSNARLSITELDELANKYHDCLCKDCLEGIIQEKE
jgi:hypothetical protein